MTPAGAASPSPAMAVSAHLLRKRRQVLCRAPLLRTLAERTAAARGALDHSSLRTALRFIERDVVPLADLEDAISTTVVVPESAARATTPEEPGHDEIHTTISTLSAAVATPSPSRTEVAAELRQLARQLVRHIHEEWDTLLPKLAYLDDTGATALMGMLPTHATGGRSSSDHLVVPRPAAPIRALIRDPVSRPWLEDRLATAARRSVKQSAAVASGSGTTFRLSVQLLPTVSNDRASLVIG